MKKIIFAVIIGLASILTVCDTKASVCPDGCDGPYWMQVPHPFQLTGCDVLFEYCTGIDSITGKLMVYIGEIIIPDRASCSVEALLSIDFLMYVPYLVSKVLESNPELNLKMHPCSTSQRTEMIIVIVNKCMSEVHYNPDYSPSELGVGGYVYRECQNLSGYCEFPVKACLNDYGEIIYEGFPSVPPDENECTPKDPPLDFLGRPVRCYSNCK